MVLVPLTCHPLSEVPGRAGLEPVELDLRVRLFPVPVSVLLSPSGHQLSEAGQELLPIRHPFGPQQVKPSLTLLGVATHPAGVLLAAAAVFGLKVSHQ